MGGRFLRTLYLLLNFAVNLKWLKKINSIKKEDTAKYHFTPTRMTIIKTMTSLGKEMENRNPHVVLVGM